MEMRDGTLGVVTIAVAVAIAVFGSYLAGVTAEENEVTKFNYLADVSTQFSYDQSPQYIEFDPNTNYTGYYSNSSYFAPTDEYYFAVDEVSYTSYKDADGKPLFNNYTIEPIPVFYPQTSVDLSDLSLSHVSGMHTLHYYYDDSPVEDVNWYDPYGNTIVTLTDLINKLKDDNTLPSDAGVIRISLSNADWDATPVGYALDLGTILIIPQSYFDNDRITEIAKPGLDVDYLNGLPRPGNRTIYTPFQSFAVDINTGNVTAYYNVDFSNPASGTFKAENMWVLYGNNRGFVEHEDYLNLGTTMIYQVEKEQHPDHLDPNYGVSLKDGA